MGVTTKNAPKVIGSTVLGGGAAMAATNVLGPVLQAGVRAFGFEGGQVDIPNYREKVL